MATSMAPSSHIYNLATAGQGKPPMQQQMPPLLSLAAIQDQMAAGAKAAAAAAAAQAGNAQQHQNILAAHLGKPSMLMPGRI
jgi:hypothetical protein